MKQRSLLWIAGFMLLATPILIAQAPDTVKIDNFTHEPPVAAGQPNRGAMHTAEIPYVFNIPGRLWTDVDRALAEAISSYWVNFAATGDPNGQGLPAWPQYRDKKTGRAMILGDKVEGESAPDTARLALYDAMFLRQLTATKTH